MASVAFYHKYDPCAGTDTPPSDAGAGGNPPPADGGGNLLDGATGGGNDQQFELPDKFKVAKEDGSVDWEQVARKGITSYRELEKRMGAVELPPKSADEYKLEKWLPDGYEANPDNLKPIMSKMHELGLNNKQVQGVLSLYGEQLNAGLAAEKQSFESAIATLKEKWGGEAQKNLELANTAVGVYATDEEKAFLQSNPQKANDPFWLSIFARVGADLGEDKLPNQNTPSGGDNELDALRKSPAYWDEKHPEHRATVAKVTALYEKQNQGSKK